MPAVADILKSINREILNPVVALLFAVALAVFLWGLIEFLVSGDSAQKRASGQWHMLWGVVGMTIMVSAKAIILLVTNTFRLAAPF